MADMLSAGPQSNTIVKTVSTPVEIVTVPLDIYGETLNPDIINPPFPLHYCLQQIIFPSPKYDTLYNAQAGIIANDIIQTVPLISGRHDNDIIRIMYALTYYLTAAPNAPRYVPTALKESQHLTPKEWIDYLTYAEGMLPDYFYYSVPYVTEFLRLIGYSATKNWSQKQLDDWFNKAMGAKLTADDLLKVGSTVNPIVKAVVGTIVTLIAVPAILHETGLTAAEDAVIDVYANVGSAITAGLSKIKDDLFDDIFNVDVFKELLVEVVKTNISNQLNGVRSDVDSYIKQLTQSSGVDLSDVNEAWRGFTGLMVRDITNTLGNVTSSALNTILKHTTETEKAVAAGEGQVWNNMLALNQATGQAFADGLFNMLFVKAG